MQLEGESNNFSLETFDDLCNGLEESMGYEQLGYSLTTLAQYLQPTFFLDHPQQWERGYNILLKHIISDQIPHLTRRKAMGYLEILLNITEEIDIKGDRIEIKQKDLLKETGLYDRGIKTITQCRHTSNGPIARRCRSLLENEGINPFTD
jgi:hypothetical protein